MFAAPHYVTALRSDYLSAMSRLSDALSAAGEQWVDLLTQSTTTARADLLRQIQTLAAAKNMAEVMSLQAALAQNNAQQALGFTQAAYSWVVDTQTELSKVTDALADQWRQSFSALVDDAGKAAPAGSELVLTTFKQAMSSAARAYGAVSEVSKPPAQVAAAPVASATHQMAAARRKAA